MGEGPELSDTFLERVGMLLGKIYAGKRTADLTMTCWVLWQICVLQ